MTLDILIVGAGIGGLAATVALRKSGHKVIVLEKSPAKSEDGFDLSCTPNVSRTLKALGVDLSSIGLTPWEGIDAFEGDKDPLLQTWKADWNSTPGGSVEGKYGSECGFVHRVDLHTALWRLATLTVGEGHPAVIKQGVKVRSFDASSAKVTTESGEIYSADLVVAADGMRSEAHWEVLGEKIPVTRSKLTSVRFLVTTKAMLNHPTTKDVIMNSYGRMGYYSGKDPTVGLFRSACRDNNYQNFGVYVYRQIDEAATWTASEIRKIALDALKDYKPPIRDIIEQANEESFYLRKVYDRDPLHLYYRDRLILLGDACHPMMPSYGQGAGSAIEDAAVLGVVLKDDGSDTFDITERLELWQSLRKPRTSATVLLSRRTSTKFEVVDDSLRASVRRILPEDELCDFDPQLIIHWLWSYDCIAAAEEALRAKSFGKNLACVEI